MSAQTPSPNTANSSTTTSNLNTASQQPYAIPLSGDGCTVATSAWGLSIYNLIARSQADPTFDLSAHPTSIIDNPVSFPRFQRHDLKATWWFRRTSEVMRVYDGKTGERMNWMVRKEDEGWEVRWGDMSGGRQVG